MHQLVDRECILKFGEVWNVVYNIYLKFVPMTTLPMNTGYLNTEDIVHAAKFVLAEDLHSYLCLNRTLYGLEYNAKNLSDTAETKITFMDVMLTLESYHVPLHNSSFADDLINLFNNKTIDVIIDDKKFQFQIKVVNANEASVFVSDTDQEFVECRNMAFSLEFTRLLSTLVIQNITFLSRKKYCKEQDCLNAVHPKPFDLLQLTGCPKVNVIQYSWKLNLNGSVTFPGGFVIDSPMFYIPADQNMIYVCIDTFQAFLDHWRSVSAVKNKKNDFVGADTRYNQFVVFCVLSGLSILALISTFLSFFVFPNFRQTTFQKNKMALVGYMLCAQVLLLASKIDSVKQTFISCLVVACLSHFFHLLTTFWNNVCTFHVFRHGRQMRLQENPNFCKQFVLYLLYALACSLVCVALNILVFYFLYKTLGYGNGTCFITHLDMLMFTIDIPIGLVTLANLYMFVHACFTLRHGLYNVTEERNVHQIWSELIFHTQLTVIIGFTWFFGNLHLYLKLEVIDYMFSVLTMCQGVFLFYGILLNTQTNFSFETRQKSIRKSKKVQKEM